MKRIVSLIAILAILYSCNDRLSVDIQKDDLVPVKLSLSGEVVVDEEPMTKGSNSNDFIAIQVYQENMPYAYGIFEDADNINIYLHSERNYSFKVEYIKNGRDKLQLIIGSRGEGCYYGSGQWYSGGDYYSDYRTDPYICHVGNTVYYRSDGYCVLQPSESRQTYYGKLTTLYYDTGRLKGYKVSNKLPNEVYSIAGITNRFCYDEGKWMTVGGTNGGLNLDRYYGEGSFLSVRGNGNTVAINMKHLVYSIQCNVTGVSDGTASITIKRDNTVLLNKTDISGEYHSDELFFTCSDGSGAWQYSDNYTENLTVSMTWLRGVGVLQDLGSQVIQVKRNCKNVINVSLSTSLSSPAVIVNQSE